MASAIGTFLGGSSLLFQFEGDESRQPRSKPGHPSPLDFAMERVAMLATPSTAFAQRLLRDVRCFVKALLYESPQADVDTVELASRLAAVGHSLTVRSALGGGGSCFRNLRHEFLIVRGTDDEEGVDHVVDLRFREQFFVPQASDAYQQLVESVPMCYVGPMGKLLPLVQLLCGEMAESFKSKSLTLPPWRRTASMLSKWMPTRMRDVNFTEPGSSPPGPGTAIDRPPVAASSGFERFSADVYNDTAAGCSPRSGQASGDGRGSGGGVSQLIGLERRKTVQIGFALM